MYVTPARAPSSVSGNTAVCVPWLSVAVSAPSGVVAGGGSAHVAVVWSSLGAWPDLSAGGHFVAHGSSGVPIPSSRVWSGVENVN